MAQAWRPVIVVAALLSFASGARAAEPTLDEMRSGGRLAPRCLTLYQTYLLGSYNRAFAIGPRGGCGYATGARTLKEAQDRAKAFCSQSVPFACTVVATNDIAPDKRAATPAEAAPLVRDPTFPFRGPGEAAGAIIWGHGRAALVNGVREDRRAAPTAPLMRALAFAGWDLFRAERAPDRDNNADGLALTLEGIERLRAMGYKRIVLAGQSAGGWLALTAMGRIDGLHGVIALAPASHGNRTVRTTRRELALREFEDLLKARRDPATRVVVALFAADDYDPDPQIRGRLLRTAARSPGLPLLLIDRPRALKGHSAGTTLTMARDYGACVRDFVQSPQAIRAGVRGCPR
ncbi:MAG: alpha/beta hydrolase [Alphaproteobacteria bacterium]|nr:alpha/beta hydrolase [Alphaproteobacteria bacterium]MCW5738960.1 alpha/beta hydrolase [Alphaproteobacteria bacterium]